MSRKIRPWGRPESDHLHILAHEKDSTSLILVLYNRLVNIQDTTLTKP